MKRFAVCPGSYDPVTRGHEDIVRRAAAIFGACEVWVMNNENKTYDLSLEQRADLCRAAFREDRNIRVFAYEGLLLDRLRERPGAVLVKGIRTAEDLEYERPMSDWHREKGGFETLFLDAIEEYRTLSSTKVRQVIAEKGDLSPFVSRPVEEFYQNKL